MWSDFAFNEAYDGGFNTVIFGVELPKEYVDFMKLHNGGEGDTGESWLVLFPIEELQDINEEYNEFLPSGHIIIGSNGGGELFGLNSDGKYFIVPELIEEEYLEVIGESIENLPADINKYWEEN